MFDWFWEFLYMISSTLFRLIDGLILCANKLCGIDTINFEGKDDDLLTYLIFSDEVGFAFRISAILASILLVVFTVFMIIRSIAKEKVEGTPGQIAVNAFKTIVMFFIVPLVVIAFITVGNAFVKALYRATMQETAKPGTFLFSALAQDGGMPADVANLFRVGELDYTSTSLVADNMILSNFPFIFSYIAGGVVLFGIGSAMLVFVDRILSLVLLYIAAPISLSTSALDEGARFKLWRDQFLTKFIMGYGMILAINIYALICGLVTKPGFTFFPGEDSTFLDLIMKLLIIGGGALTMQKSMALIGNLVSSGAGSNELRDSMSAGALASATKRIATGVGGKALSAAGYLTFAKAGKSILGDALSLQSRHLGMKMLRGIGLDGGYPRKKGKDGEGDSDSKNNEKADYGSKDSAKNAINNDDGFKTSFNSDSANNNQAGSNKNNAVGKAINGGDNKKNDTGSSNTSNNNSNNTQAAPSQQGGDKK